MAIKQKTSVLKLSTYGWKSLGISNLTADVVTCEQGLIEGIDFEINRPHGSIRRLKEFGRELYTFSCQYDDFSEARAAKEQEHTKEKNTGTNAIDDFKTYMDLDSPTVDQTIAVVKLLCKVAIILIKRSLK